MHSATGFTYYVQYDTNSNINNKLVSYFALYSLTSPWKKGTIFAFLLFNYVSRHAISEICTQISLFMHSTILIFMARLEMSSHWSRTWTLLLQTMNLVTHWVFFRSLFLSLSWIGRTFERVGLKFRFFLHFMGTNSVNSSFISIRSARLHSKGIFFVPLLCHFRYEYQIYITRIQLNEKDCFAEPGGATKGHAYTVEYKKDRWMKSKFLFLWRTNHRNFLPYL